MPIYEYLCRDCGYKGEQVVSFEDRHLVHCPLCRKVAELLVSVPHVKMDTFIGGRIDPAFGYVTSRQELERKEKAAGLRPSEVGDGASAKSARIEKSKKEDVIREKIIGETVKDFCI